MTNAELLAKIKAEIERRIEESRTRQKNLEALRQKNANIVEEHIRATLKALLSFLSALESEKPVPEDLEEAAEKYAYGDMPDEMKPYVKPVGDEVFKNFIAGAEWQKEQDNAISRQAEAERIKTQQMCYEKGQADMKRKMMEEAVEGEVMTNGFYPYEPRVVASIPGTSLDFGDKVRVIVLPKED